MKRIQLWLAVLLMVPALNALADPLPAAVQAALGSGRSNDLISNAPSQSAPSGNHGGDQGGNGQQGSHSDQGGNQGQPVAHGDQGGSHSQPGTHVEAGQSSQGSQNSSHQPVVINMNHGSSGGHNRNFPSQQPAPSQAQQPAQQNHNDQRSYGKINWNKQAPVRKNSNAVRPNQVGQRPAVQNFNTQGQRAAVVVHHHPYTQGYVRKKLQKLGVTSAPALITQRAEIIHTDRAHSVIKYPQHGPSNLLIKATLISPRHYNDDLVRNRMMVVDSPEWRAKVNQANNVERLRNHYYWHTSAGLNYCHFIDDSGYHWYGWYQGNQYYWTRYFNGRWWTYDADYDRWCFFNNNFWWWQDPYHVGDLYCYTNTAYVPCNSANDQIVIAAPTDDALSSAVSPDGTRMVRIDSQTQDAFLYDTADQPTFDPVYLASGVKDVQFSEATSGRPLEIILKLNDGSFDMFDGYGNPYNSGSEEN